MLDLDKVTLHRCHDARFLNVDYDGPRSVTSSPTAAVTSNESRGGCAGVGRPRWMSESPRSALSGPRFPSRQLRSARWLKPRHGRRRRAVGRPRRRSAVSSSDGFHPGLAGREFAAVVGATLGVELMRLDLIEYFGNRCGLSARSRPPIAPCIDGATLPSVSTVVHQRRSRLHTCGTVGTGPASTASRTRQTAPRLVLTQTMGDAQAAEYGCTPTGRGLCAGHVRPHGDTTIECRHARSSAGTLAGRTDSSRSTTVCDAVTPTSSPFRMRQA